MALGTEPCGWLTALLGMNRAGDCKQFCEATRPWLVPTFNIVCADADGHIGMQTVGRIPLRRQAERGYRPGWDPQHQWTGVIPFEDMPRLSDPPRGFVVSANNRLAPEDFPYPLTGRWSGGYRARRIREQIQSQEQVTGRLWSRKDCEVLHQDVYSMRGQHCVPALLALLAGEKEPVLAKALEHLSSGNWNGQVSRDSVGAAIFNAFFPHWCKAVTAARMPAEAAGFMSANVGGLAVRLLQDDPHGWFPRQRRVEAARDALRAALDELTTRLRTDMRHWQWGRLHTLLQKHFLSGRGDLGQLLDHSGAPLDGDATTVFSNTPDPNYAAWLGAGYRMIVDFAEPAAGLWHIEVGSVSGHPGSPHYDDQLKLWHEGGYRYVSLDEGGKHSLSLKSGNEPR